MKKKEASMSRDWKPSNETTDYDEARVDRLKPVITAIDRLGLPIPRQGKFRTITNAIEVQLETGGDNPEVNRLLLEALRVALRHQVGETGARSALSAIATFEKAEERRWESIRSGNSPPI
jgi:hypothetical protein